MRAAQPANGPDTTRVEALSNFLPWSPLITATDEEQLNAISTVTEVSSVSGTNQNLPEKLKLRTFTIGGAGGPSLQIAENFGATPVQITVDGVKILSTNAVQGKYKRDLTGAGTIGGMPIVAPAGRTYDRNGEAAVWNGDTKLFEFPQELIGPGGRIPKYSDKSMSHGAIFTSANWKFKHAKTLEDKGVEVVYELDFQNPEDSAIKPMGTGKIQVTYTFVKGEDGKVIFDSKIETRGSLHLGPVATHTFLSTDASDTLQTAAEQEIQSPQDKPELPTGEVIPVSGKNDFRTEKQVHGTKDIEVVLTGYDQTEDKIPRAVLHRKDKGLLITTEACGIPGYEIPGYDGFLVCNKVGKDPEGSPNTDKLMLEPIAGYPNISNVARPGERQAIVTSGDKQFGAHYRLTIQAQPKV
jgi:hypothetical protein